MEDYAEFWRSNLELLCGRGGAIHVPNPALSFSARAKSGAFDYIPDGDYQKKLKATQGLAAFWRNRASAPVSEVLLEALSSTPIPPKALDVVVDTLTECSSAWLYLRQDSPETCEDGSSLDAEPEAELDGAGNPKPFPQATPWKIYDYLNEHVHGQDEAKRVAAMIMYKHLHFHRTNAVFCGPSGCGKTEIWRTLASRYPGRIRIIDASRLSGDGWKGARST